VEVKNSALNREIKNWGVEYFIRVNFRDTARHFERYIDAAGRAWALSDNLATTLNTERDERRLHGWIFDQLSKEFSAVYGGKPSPANGEYTGTIRDYPRLIRQAGRIDMVAEIELEDKS
jgi:hypothetical protein